MRSSWRTELPALLVLVCWFVVVAAIWNHAPDQLPTHMNFRGEVDAFGGKFTGLLLAPITTVALYLFLLMIPRWDKNLSTGANRFGTYPLFRLAIVVLLLLVDFLVLVRGLYPERGGAMMLPVLLGALFLFMGNLMGKIRPNRSFGVRTPWTFKSKRAWIGSHRVGGWLFFGEGLVLILLAFVRPQAWAFVFLGSSTVIVLFLFVYSYSLYRSDPDPVPPFSS